MRLTKSSWWGFAREAIAVLLLAIGLGPAGMGRAQGISTTTVQGTVYLANGKPGKGTLVVSWPAFTTAMGQSVAADKTTVTIAADGFVSVNLAPNQGATPAGLYYTAVFYLSDGTVNTQYWVVSAMAQATLAQVQAQVMPAAQAVQAVSKGYVDQTISELTESLLTASGGNLSGPLYLNGDPAQPTQAATKHYVDNQVGTAVPLSGGSMTGALTLSSDPAQPLEAADKEYVDAAAANAWPAMVLRADQFPGADFGAKLQACLGAVSASYGGTCDARNFIGPQSMGANLTIATGNTTVLLPCATITTTSEVVVTAGTRNVALRGCALRGGSAASGSQGGTVFAYSGAGAMVRVGDPTYATDTPGFHMDNVAINTTGSTSATAEGLAAYRTQEMDVESVYFLGNANQTGMTLDGTGNYTGGTFLDVEISGFQTAVNATGHQAANAATTDWMNASAFVRLHIDCPTSGGRPVAGTTGISLQAGDGNTFTGGDIEGCATALHLGANAENNTIVGLRNENSTSQVVADAGSAYNNWMTGGTMFTGQLTDQGTRNSFLDSFHRSFNGLNGDWYGSQQDATLTNHYRLGTGTGNERGLVEEYQTDYGYRWQVGPGDGTSGEQFYNFTDMLNNLQRIGIGQYLSATANVVTNVLVNSGGCYSSSAAPAVSFAGGGGSGAAATATMTATSSLSCSGGYTVGSVTMTAGGSGYRSQPVVSFAGPNQTGAPNAVAEITTAGSTNNQTVINSAGTGAVVLNGSNNAGTGGVVFGSGGGSETTVGTVDRVGNAQFNGTLQVGGTAQSTGTMTVRNNADAEVDYYLWPGLTASQKGSFTYKDFNGASQWYLVKDLSNNWALNSAIGGLDSFKAYQSNNTGDTYVNAINATGHIRLNYETGTGAETDIYSGGSSNLAAAFSGPASIKFPGLAAASGHNCMQIDNSGWLTNAGFACGTATNVPAAGLAFSDASVQTTSQQGALTGAANDATARGQAAAETARAQAAEAEEETEETSEITRAEAAEASAQATANASLPANGATSMGSGADNVVTFPGAVAVGATMLTANSLTSLNAAITTLGGNSGSILVNGAITLTANLTIPANVQTQVLVGGAFTLGSYNLNINGPFSTPPSGTFIQNGSGRVYFGAGAVRAANPSWWTTSWPNAYDRCQSAITAAVGATGSTLASTGIELTPGTTYLCNPVFISGASTIKTWAPSTSYAVGNLYSQGGNLYLVITAGTSATSAPTYATAQDALTTDGTAVVMFAATLPSNMPPVLPNVPAFIEGNNATIQAAPGSSGTAVLSLIEGKNNSIGPNTQCSGAGAPFAWCTGAGSWSNAGCIGAGTPYNWCSGAGSGAPRSPGGLPTPHYRNLFLNAAGLMQHAIFWLGSPGEITRLQATNALGCGVYSDAAVGAGTYYNTFTDVVSAGNSGCGIYETGQSIAVLANNANTWIHPQSRRNLGAGWEVNIAENDHYGAEIENNNGVGIHVRGVYTNTLFSGGWAEANNEGVAQGGAVNGQLDIGLVAAGEETDQATTSAGINGLNVRGMRMGYVMPWLTWTPNTAYPLGVNVIPPANSSCAATNNLCLQAWQANTSYNAGDVVLSKSAFTGNGRWYQAGGGCASGGAEPTWSTAEAATVADGTCTWTAHALAYQIQSPGGAGTSGSSPPTWKYAAAQTITDGTATWQVQAQNILARSAGNDIWVNSGNSGVAPAMGPGGDLLVQSVSVVAPISLPSGSTAATQTPATDNSNNVATNRFVQNAIAAAAPGAVVANWSQTGQSANVPCTLFYTVSSAGMYRASAYLVVTQAATTSSTMPNAVINFTDPDTSVVETSVSLTGTSSANTVGQTSNKTGTNYPTSMVFRAAAGSPVKGCTASYISSGATPMLYNVYFKLESLGQ